MSEKLCGELASFFYTWPGKDQCACCVEHAGQLKGVANAIGLHLQLIPILYSVRDVIEEFPTCQQKVKA